jgi:predicted dehydrogenase
MSNIRIAIIGQGAIGPRHTDAVMSTPGTALACIVDPHPSAAHSAVKYNCPIFTSVDAMLENESIDFDAAIVCTPNHTHVAISKQLLQAGKHVLCEKPICVDVASGQELVRACSRALRSRCAKTHRSNALKPANGRF